MGAFYILQQNEVTTNAVPNVAVGAIELQSSSNASQETARQHQVVKASSSESKKSDSKFTPKEFQELNAWLIDRGYDSYTNRGDYESYSEETLSKLAKNGDLKAIGLLIPKFLERGDVGTAIRLMNTGVVYGSTAHLDNLTLFSGPNASNDATEESRRPAVLETLALTKVIALRGDTSLSENSKSTFLKNYKQKYNMDITLSDEEKRMIDERAQEMYDSYEDVRRSLGLGDYDNSAPEGVKKFFGSSR